MKPTKTGKKLAQTLAGGLKINGEIGPRSRARLRAKLDIVLPDDRLVAGMVQKHTPAKLDFWWGPNTEFHADELWAEIQGNPAKPRPDEDDQPFIDSPRCWSPTDRQMIAEYGRPGVYLVTVNLPFPVKLAWDTSTVVTKTSVHPKVKDRFLAAMTEIREHYTRSERENLRIDRYGGGYNKRKKRGGSTWSAHAFGAAFDWDPDRNKLRWNRHRASFAKPAYAAWWNAWQRQGFIGLGPCFDFDWMHVQANPGSAPN